MQASRREVVTVTVGSSGNRCAVAVKEVPRRVLGRSQSARGPFATES